MVCRSGFVESTTGGTVTTVVIVGNAGGAMRPHFEATRRVSEDLLDIWPSPIGIDIHPDDGLRHAYRGALFGRPLH
jgi:hypothetical protein|tara:strand:- start:4210 stop:4437 length:228 start_codon:yes stop_codon:yes gene_type:complete